MIISLSTFDLKKKLNQLMIAISWVSKPNIPKHNHQINLEARKNQNNQMLSKNERKFKENENIKFQQYA